MKRTITIDYEEYLDLTNRNEIILKKLEVLKKSKDKVLIIYEDCFRESYEVITENKAIKEAVKKMSILEFICNRSEWRKK